MVRGGAGRRRPRGVAAPAVVAALALAACSPGSSDAGGANPPTTRRTTSTTAAAPAAGASAVPTSAPAAPSTTAPPFDLRRADLGAHAYRVLCPGGELDLVPRTPSPGVDDRPVVLDPFEPQFLDLTGDGRPEAVVEVGCRVADEWSTGVRSVIVLGAEAGAVVQLGQPLEGADPTVVGAALAVGRPASVATAASGSATSVVYEPYSFDGSAWVPISAGTPVLPSDPVTVDGIGSVLVGAPFGEIAISTGRPVEAADGGATGGACVEVVLPDAPEGVAGLGGDGAVRAVHVDNPAVRTAEGLGVGSTEVEVQFAFPGQVSVLPDEAHPGGHHLIVDFPDLDGRVLRFDTDGTTVTGYAAGETGWADVAEGCA